MNQMTRRGFALGAVSSVAIPSVFADADIESSALTAAKKWFREAQYGMMVHWGLYSLMGGEWKGRRMDSRYLGEWAQQYFRIPNAEYAKLAQAFNPVCFNADEWVKVAADAGMKYLVFTSKHHDGFAMFRSKVSKYNVVDAPPFGRDVVGELAEACRRHGVRIGLYYSQDLDWHERGGGGFTEGKTWGDGAAYWTNNWDFKDVTKKEFDEYFETKAKPQVEEILTQYGDLCLIWFDVPVTLSFEQSKAFVDLVRKHQPGCLINGRIGHDLGDYFTPGDNEVPEKAKGEKLYEVIGTMNESWGYDIRDKDYKSLDEIIRNLVRSAGKNCNLLLNIGPRPDGLFPAEAMERLKGIGEWMKVNGETIYGTRGGMVGPREWGVTTQKGNRLFVHIMNSSDKGLYLPIDAKKVKSAKMFVSGEKVVVNRSGDGITLSLPEAPKGVDTIVEVTLAGR